ncbi:MAG: hypothetical protein WB557_27010 [Solirubrobacteraceae bacterium]
MLRRVLIGGVGVGLSVLACAPGAIGASPQRRGRAARGDVTAAPAQAVEVSLQASPPASVSDGRVVLSGQATGVSAGSVVELYDSAYPYSATLSVQSTVTGGDGSFSFVVFPDRDTRYQATVANGAAASPLVQVGVAGVEHARVKVLSLGRARVAIVLSHPSDLRWGDARTSWWFASGYRGPFTRAPATRTVNLGGYVTVLSTTVALPAGHFRWRACFHAPGDQALEDPGNPPGCSGRGYQGGGHLPVGFPGPPAIARAERYLASRGGRTALATVDSEGRVSGVNLNEQFITGSVVKAMLLVAYLRRLNAIGQHYIDPYSNSFLYPMINVSDNDAATTCWSIVGNAGLYAVAAAAGMTHFSVDTTASWGGSWGAALITAADQAKFFFEMDSLIPQEFVGYANYLLSTIAGYESWGIPAIARPLGYTVFFKAGWRPSPDVFLVHQIARLVGHHHTFAIAAMTDGDPDMDYGIDTIQGVTQALLG